MYFPRISLIFISLKHHCQERRPAPRIVDRALPDPAIACTLHFSAERSHSHKTGRGKHDKNRVMMPLRGRLNSRGATSTSGGDGSDTNSSPGLFITPLRGNRARMMTEETVFVHNTSIDLADVAAEAMRQVLLEESDHGEANDDNNSTVSSLSDESMHKLQDETPTKRILPHVISIPTPATPLESIHTPKHCTPLPPPVWTGLHSPSLPRPRAPKHGNIATLSLTPKTPRKTIHVPPAIAENQITRSVSLSVSKDFTDESTKGTTSSHAKSYSSSELALLGNRPKRRHRRVASGAPSVGSLVGQSSLKTAPTTGTLTSASSGNDQSTAFLSLNSHGQEQNPKLRWKKPVRDELKFMFGRVTTPIRRLANAQEQKPDLRRAKGCLT